MEDTEIKNIKDSREYEFAFLAKSEEDASEAKKLILSQGAEITSEGAVRQITLAYPILDAQQAYFGYVHAKIVPDQAKLLEQNFKVRPGLLRSLVLKLTTVSKRSVAGERPRFGNRPVAVIQKSATEKHAPLPTAVLSNEALEKKIEEILQ